MRRTPTPHAGRSLGKGTIMSRVSYDVPQPGALSDEERETLRRHYLVYAQAELRQGRKLRADLDHIYATVDELASSGKLDRLVSTMHTSAHVVLFSTEASRISLEEFQLAMLSEGRPVRMVGEDSSDINGIGALSEGDLLIVVTTSNGFAHRQRANICRSEAHKVIITAHDDPELHAEFDEVLSIGEGASEGSPLHRIYATFGVTYFFDRLFTLYANTYDPEL